MITLIENGELFTPGRIGKQALLIANDQIVKIGAIDRRGLDQIGLAYEVLDAHGHFVIPGLIDPHEHLAGASGSTGFGSETPPIFFEEIVSGGITTVVGTVGTDTTTMPVARLLARVKTLNQSGITEFCYTGGYNVPPSTITGDVRDDLLLIQEVIGAGEISIADDRATCPSPRELAKLVSDAHVGGMLSGKAGVSHFHVGPRDRRLAPLRELLDDFDVKPEWLYPTHVERNEALMREAMELVQRGATIDIDVVEKDLHKWLRFYFEQDGDRTRCTVSSDAFSMSPQNLLAQLRICVLEHSFRLEEILPFATSNTARVLKLPQKGKLSEGCDADIAILNARSLELHHVFARGQHVVANGTIAIAEGFLSTSDRQIHLRGQHSVRVPKP